MCFIIIIIIFRSYFSQNASAIITVTSAYSQDFWVWVTMHTFTSVVLYLLSLDLIVKWIVCSIENTALPKKYCQYNQCSLVCKINNSPVPKEMGKGLFLGCTLYTQPWDSVAGCVELLRLTEYQLSSSWTDEATLPPCECVRHTAAMMKSTSTVGYVEVKPLTNYRRSPVVYLALNVMIMMNNINKKEMIAVVARFYWCTTGCQCFA